MGSETDRNWRREVNFFGLDRRAMKVAAFVPGYVEDFEDLEDFEPEGVTLNSSQKEVARREEELSGLAEAGKRAREREEKELKAKKRKRKNGEGREDKKG